MVENHRNDVWQVFSAVEREIFVPVALPIIAIKLDVTNTQSGRNGGFV